MGRRKSRVLEKAARFEEANLLNAYRILKNPDIVLKMVTQKNATFMWADVQNILARYVDDPQLFQRLEGKLRNSSELIVLHQEESRRGGLSIYTTKSMANLEKSSGDLVEKLMVQRDHPAVLEPVFESEEVLSSDQESAIRHVVSEANSSVLLGTREPEKRRL